MVEIPIGETLHLLIESHHIDHARVEIDNRVWGLGSGLAYKLLLEHINSGLGIGALGLPKVAIDSDISNKMRELAHEFKRESPFTTGIEESGVDLAFYAWAHWCIAWLLREEDLIEVLTHKYQSVAWCSKKNQFCEYGELH